MPAARGAVIVVGGAGALGRAMVSRVRERVAASLSPCVISVDMMDNVSADRSVLVGERESEAPEREREPDGGMDWVDGVADVTKRVEEILNGEKARAVLCAAGGWMGGSVSTMEGVAAVGKMMQFNMESAVLAAHMAGRMLDEQGVLVFTGAAGVLEPAPFMVGYGMAKVCTHYLAQSVAVDEEFPKDISSLAVLPTVLDTKANREAMPDVDQSTWVQPVDVAERVADWIYDPASRPPSGSLVKVSKAEDGSTLWES